MKVSEKMLEDWICENPKVIYYNIEILERQLRLKHGVLDLLGWSDGFGLLAIELKRGTLREQDIGQVLRYTHDINKILSDMWFELDMFIEESPDVDQAIIDHLKKMRQNISKTFTESLYCEMLKDSPKCTPMLIGKSIDEKTFAAAEGCGAHVLVWVYDEETQTIRIRPTDLELIGEGFTEHYPNWSIDCVQRHLKKMAWDADFLFDRHIAEGLFAKIR
jgi:hypothetical protein